MSQWWVRTETDINCGLISEWHGPYSTADAANSTASRLSKPYSAQGIVAEVVSGEEGSNGLRFAEYFAGRSYPPGQSGWYESPPSPTVPIPVRKAK